MQTKELKIYEAQCSQSNKFKIGEQVGILEINYNEQKHHAFFRGSDTPQFSIVAEHDPFESHDYNVIDKDNDDRKLMGKGSFVIYNKNIYIHLLLENSQSHFLVHIHTKKLMKAA